MRILQINTVCDKGSTGRITRELADFYEKEGHECYIAFGYGKTTYSNSFKIGGKLENLFHNAFYTRLLGLHGYGTRRGTLKLLNWIAKMNNIRFNFVNPVKQL